MTTWHHQDPGGKSRAHITIDPDGTGRIATEADTVDGRKVAITVTLDQRAVERLHHELTRPALALLAALKPFTVEHDVLGVGGATRLHLNTCAIIDIARPRSTDEAWAELAPTWKRLSHHVAAGLRFGLRLGDNMPLVLCGCLRPVLDVARFQDRLNRLVHEARADTEALRAWFFEVEALMNAAEPPTAEKSS